MIGAAVLLFAAACTRNPKDLYDSARIGLKEGRFEDAEKLAGQGYRAYPDLQSEWHWKFALLLAEIQLYHSRIRGASDFLAKQPPAEFPSLVARYEMLRGYSSLRPENVAQARNLLNDAIAQAQRARDPETESDAWLWFGMWKGNRSELEGADADFQRAQKLAQTNHFDFQHAQALLNRGLIQIKFEKYAAAIPLLESARQLAESSHARLTRVVASNDLAMCYENLGNLDQALDLQKKNVNEIERFGLANYLSVANSELGAIHSRRGEFAEAINAFRQALKLAKKGSVLYALGAENLAAVLESTGNLDEAERYNQLAFQASNQHDKANLGTLTLTQARIAEHRGQHDQAIAGYRTALGLGQNVPSVLWQAYAGLADVYSAQGDVGHADENYSQTLKVISSNRADQLTADYKITFLSNLIRFYQAYVAFLVSHGFTDRALEIADSSRASVLAEDLLGQSEPSRTGLLKDIQRAARASHSVFLFYWLAPKNSYAWAISATQSKAVPLPDQNQIAKDVAAYRALIEEQKRDPLSTSSPAGVRLYQELIAPVSAILSPGVHVVVVPDGVLHNLNFETLLVSTPKPHYWIEDVTISVAPSLGLLQAGKPTTTAHRSLLVMGNANMQGTGFAPLPEAALEIANIQRQFPSADSTVLTGKAAVTDAYFSSQPQKFSTIHFATHVDANAQSPLDSAIILSPQASGYRLYARDVARTPLNADLVTISACRGAGAKALSGEGLVGFAWAFFQARAKNVVTSLWDVSDNSTAQLMDNFYAGVASGDSYSSALRDAKLKLLHSNYPKPYYWAPFQLYSRTLNSVK